jgi:hypothetical protein
MSPVSINDPDVSPLTAKLAGAVMALGGLLVGYIAIKELLTPPTGPFDAVQLVLGTFLGLIVLIAIVQGSRLALARRTADLSLPRYLLIFGAILMALGGLLQIALAFLIPQAGSLLLGLALGVGGTVGSLRLLRRRSRSRAGVRPDGA